MLDKNMYLMICLWLEAVAEKPVMYHFMWEDQREKQEHKPNVSLKRGV